MHFFAEFRVGRSSMEQFSAIGEQVVLCLIDIIVKMLVNVINF